MSKSTLAGKGRVGGREEESGERGQRRGRKEEDVNVHDGNLCRLYIDYENLHALSPLKGKASFHAPLVLQSGNWTNKLPEWHFKEN